MDSDIKNLCEETLRVVQPLFARPKLSAKYLAKPPFKMLHDIIIAVSENTGFGNDVYTELDRDFEKASENRNSKIEFLRKTMDQVGTTLRKKVDLNPTSVVCGKEADKTNVFLQMLAMAATQPKGKVTQRPQKGQEGARLPPKTEAAAAASSPVTSQKSTAAPPPPPVVVSDASSPAEIAIPGTTKRKGSVAKPSLDTSGKVAAVGKSVGRGTGKKVAGGKGGGAGAGAGVESKAVTDSPKRATKKGTAVIESGSGQDSAAKTKKKRPSASGSGRGTARDHFQENDFSSPPVRGIKQRGGVSHAASLSSRPLESDVGDGKDIEDSLLVPQRPRAASIGRPPPKIQTNIRVVDSTSSRAEQGVPIVLEGKDEDQTDEEELIFISDQAPESSIIGSSRDRVKGDEAGVVVRDITRAMEELEKDGSSPAQSRIYSTSQIQRQKLEKDVARLRDFIQVITRDVRPLAKVMDFLEEDLEGMGKEYDQWKEETSQHTSVLEEEERSLELSLQTYYGRLNELDQTIKEQRLKMNAVKANILENDRRIQHMLQMVTKA